MTMRAQGRRLHRRLTGCQGVEEEHSRRQGGSSGRRLKRPTRELRRMIVCVQIATRIAPVPLGTPVWEATVDQDGYYIFCAMLRRFTTAAARSKFRTKDADGGSREGNSPGMPRRAPDWLAALPVRPCAFEGNYS